MKILYIGSSGALTMSPFTGLLNAGYTVSAVGVYKPIVFRHRVIALENESLALAASRLSIPVIDLSWPVEEILTCCDQYEIDLIVMACYSKRLPESLVYAPSYGCINLHPSMLPAYRGPEPVFWQLKAGVQPGVSWHKVVEEIDAGEIIAQQTVSIEDGMNYREINDVLAKAGIQLLLSFLPAISGGSLAGRQQSADVASYQRFPSRSDFFLDCQWTARHAYNFMCATQVFKQPYTCMVDSKTFVLNKALSYDDKAVLQQASIYDERIIIPFKEGVLIATLAGKIQQN